VGNLLMYFLELLVCQRSPADAPASPTLLAALLVVDVLLAGFASSLLGQTSFLPSVIASNLVFLICMGGIFSLRSMRSRWLQSCVAAMGAGLLFSVMGVVVSLAYQAAMSPKAGPIAAFTAITMLVLLCWQCFVLAHVLRLAVKWSMAQAIPAATAVILVSIFAARWAMPETA
jgi:hypothetical protein